MKYYIICFLDYTKDDLIQVKNLYHTKEDAINNTERVAIEYIKEMQGKQQADICKQEKTIDEILNNNKLKEGMYIIKSNNNVILYEKVNITLPGRLWSSLQMEMNKIGLFTVSDLNDDNENNNCTITKVTFSETPATTAVFTEATTLNIIKDNNNDCSTNRCEEEMTGKVEYKLPPSVFAELQKRFSGDQSNFGLKTVL